jgi:hypothetical protein
VCFTEEVVNPADFVEKDDLAAPGRALHGFAMRTGWSARGREEDALVGEIVFYDLADVAHRLLAAEVKPALAEPGVHVLIGDLDEQATGREVFAKEGGHWAY